MSRVALALVCLAGCSLGDSYHCARDGQCMSSGARGCVRVERLLLVRRRVVRRRPPLRQNGRPRHSARPAWSRAAISAPATARAAAICEPCCAGSVCSGGLSCGNGTCFLFFDGFDGAISPSWFQRAENGSTLAVDTKAYRGTGSLDDHARTRAASRSSRPISSGRARSRRCMRARSCGCRRRRRSRPAATRSSWPITTPTTVPFRRRRSA